MSSRPNSPPPNTYPPTQAGVLGGQPHQEDRVDPNPQPGEAHEEWGTWGTGAAEGAATAGAARTSGGKERAPRDRLSVGRSHFPYGAEGKGGGDRVDLEQAPTPNLAAVHRVHWDA